MSPVVSRYKTRRFVVQCLYARSVNGGDFCKEQLLEEAYNPTYKEYLDIPYFESMFSGILEKEQELLFVFQKFASRFEIEKVPLVHILIVCVGIFEILYCDDIPENVSINEAVEMTKRFSDESGKMLINAVLHNVKMQKTDLLQEVSDAEHPQLVPSLFS